MPDAANAVKISLGKIIAASMVFAGAVFLTMAAGSVYSIQRMRVAAGWVAHTEEVEANINGVLVLVGNLESGVRNYVITGSEDYLAPYNTAKQQIDGQLEHLHNLVQDSPEQSVRLDHLMALVKRKVEIATSVITTRRQKGLTAAAEMVGSPEIQQVTDNIRQLGAEMLTQENVLLAQRRDTDSQQSFQSIIAAVATSGVGLAVLALAGVVMVRQFNERLKAQEALARKTGELQGIMDHAPIGIFLKDLESRYLLLNSAMTPLLGKEPGACIGKSPTELFPAERAARILAEDQETLADGKPHEIDYEVKGADGSGRVFHTYKFILRDSQGKIYALGGISEDVTERQRMDRALRQALSSAEAASQTKSQFLANMSHELRTPLNSIIGFSEILSDKLFGTLNEKQGQYVGNILASGRHLLLLINDLLDLAKIEAGKMHLEPERTSIASLVNDGMNLVRGSAERKGVALDIAPVAASLAARLDPARTKQIIYNLVSNAVKFTPKSGRVTVLAQKVTEPVCPTRGGPRGFPPGERLGGEWLQLTVADTGIGIAAEDLERIFAEFEQVDSTYARQQEGTGLGLALTTKLANLHGGYVWAESPGRVNQGSAFHVLLPLTGPPREHEKPAKPARPAPAPIPSADVTPDLFPPATKTHGNGRPLVLMVEDDLSASHLMREHLVQGGYDVAHATNGEEALQLAAKLRPTAITLDIMLPDANGMDVLARLKATRSTSHIPVLIVSVTDDRQLGLSLGAAEFFVKPVNAEKLLSALDRVAARVRKEIQRVLVVDDEPIARESIIAVLEPRGYQVRATESGEEALRVVSEHPPDVAIIDLTMPGMSGFELVSHLRQNPATRELPICIYTSKDLTASEMHWLHQQSAAVTAKPFREQLLNELQRVCADGS
jgi:PAS domain S-box-containing protein